MIHRCVQAKPDMFRVEKVASHLGDDGIDLGHIDVIAEEFNRQADYLATNAAKMHNLPPHVIEAAKTRHRHATVLHSVAVSIYDRRHRALPLPHRRAGFTEAELSKMEPNPMLAAAAPPVAGPAVPMDPDELWAEAQRHAADDDDEDPFGYGGGMDFLDGDGGPHVDASASAAHAGQRPTPTAPTGPPQHVPAPPRTDGDDDFDDPFGLGGSMDNLPSPTLQPGGTAVASARLSVSCPSTSARPASAASHDLTPAGPVIGTHAALSPRVTPAPQPGSTVVACASRTVPCLSTAARPASAASYDHTPATLALGSLAASSGSASTSASLVPKPEDTSHSAQAHRRTDRQTALADHLARQADTQSAPSGKPRADPTRTHATKREAELQRSTAALQQRCAVLAADLAAAHARQGPLLQRLHRAGRAFADLIHPSNPSGAPTPPPSLHAMLSSLRGAPPGAPP